MNKLRTNQGGSVANFIIIGVIIVSCLAGAIYLVNFRSEQARKDQEIASEKKDEADKKTTKTNSEKVNPPTDSDNDDVSSLPATGPESNFIQLLGIFSLSTVSVAFISSRKKLSRSL